MMLSLALHLFDSEDDDVVTGIAFVWHKMKQILVTNSHNDIFWLLRLGCSWNEKVLININ